MIKTHDDDLTKPDILRQLNHTLCHHMQKYGYDLLDIPIIQEAGIFLTRAGDNIIDRLFTFDRHGRQLTLRPEFTAAAANRYVEQNQTEPVRWQFQGAIFEDDPSQPLTKYQRHSVGAELIGMADIHADAEMMSMAIAGIESYLPKWRLVVDHVGLQSHLLSQFDLDSRTYRLLLTKRQLLIEQGIEAVINSLEDLLPATSKNERAPSFDSTQSHTSAHQVLDVLLDSTRYGGTMGGRTRYDIVQRLLEKRERATEYENIVRALEFLQSWLAVDLPIRAGFEKVESFISNDDRNGQQILSEWKHTIELLDHYAVPEGRIYLRTNLAKNWEYYTGNLFGITDEHESIFFAGGGRYDELVGLLGGDPTPAVGFAYYIDPIVHHITSSNIPGLGTTIVLEHSGANVETAIQWANSLRNRDIYVQISSSITKSSTLTAQVQDDGGLIYDDRHYTLDTLDILIKDLKK